jgi:hypothetical protein
MGRTRGPGRRSLLLLLKIDSEDEDTEEAVRRMILRCETDEERVLRVEELGVEGLINEGKGLGEEGRLRWFERWYGWLTL